MNPPLWARKIIVFLTMLLAVGVMYLTLPPEGKQSFLFTLSEVGIPTFGLIALMGIFLVLVRWADGKS